MKVLPTKFVDEVMLTGQKYISLVDASGKNHKCRIRNATRNGKPIHYLGGKWYWFSKDMKLNIGDTVKFYFMNDPKYLHFTVDDGSEIINEN